MPNLFFLTCGFKVIIRNLKLAAKIAPVLLILILLNIVFIEKPRSRKDSKERFAYITKFNEILGGRIIELRNCGPYQGAMSEPLYLAKIELEYSTIAHYDARGENDRYLWLIDWPYAEVFIPKGLSPEIGHYYQYDGDIDIFEMGRFYYYAINYAGNSGRSFNLDSFTLSKYSEQELMERMTEYPQPIHVEYYRIIQKEKWSGKKRAIDKLIKDVEEKVTGRWYRKNALYLYKLTRDSVWYISNPKMFSDYREADTLCSYEDEIIKINRKVYFDMGFYNESVENTAFLFNAQRKDTINNTKYYRVYLGKFNNKIENTEQFFGVDNDELYVKEVNNQYYYFFKNRYRDKDFAEKYLQYMVKAYNLSYKDKLRVIQTKEE